MSKPYRSSLMSVEPAGERARQIPYMLGSQSKVIGLTSTAASIMDDKILLFGLEISFSSR